MKSIEIDRGKHLRDQPTTGHNRFHPDIPPLVTVDEGEEVVLATRDGVDGQLGPGTTEADMAKMEAGAIHPLTGPVFVKGARPRSEEHTSELQSLRHLVCRLLLEKKK